MLLYKTKSVNIWFKSGFFRSSLTDITMVQIFKTFFIVLFYFQIDVYNERVNENFVFARNYFNELIHYYC